VAGPPLAQQFRVQDHHHALYLPRDPPSRPAFDPFRHHPSHPPRPRRQSRQKPPDRV